MFPSKLHSQHRRSQTLQPLHPPVSTHIYKHTPARARPSGRELQQANLWDPREGKGQGTQTGLTSLPPFRVSKLGTPYTYSTYTSNFFQTWWTQQSLEQHSLLTLGPPFRNIRHFKSQRYFKWVRTGLLLNMWPSGSPLNSSLPPVRSRCHLSLGPRQGYNSSVWALATDTITWAADKTHFPESWAVTNTQFGPVPLLQMTMKSKEGALWAKHFN